MGLLGTKRVGRGQGVEGNQSGVVLGIYKTRVCVRAPEILLPSHCGRKVPVAAIGILCSSDSTPPGQRRVGTKGLPALPSLMLWETLFQKALDDVSTEQCPLLGPMPVLWPMAGPRERLS